MVCVILFGGRSWGHSPLVPNTVERDRVSRCLTLFGAIGNHLSRYSILHDMIHLRTTRALLSSCRLCTLSSMIWGDAVNESHCW